MFVSGPLVLFIQKYFNILLSLSYIRPSFGPSKEETILGSVFQFKLRPALIDLKTDGETKVYLNSNIKNVKTPIEICVVRIAGQEVRAKIAVPPHIKWSSIIWGRNPPPRPDQTSSDYDIVLYYYTCKSKCYQC